MNSAMYPCNFPSAVRDGLGERLALVLDRLVVGADPQVQPDSLAFAFHSYRPTTFDICHYRII